MLSLIGILVTGAQMQTHSTPSVTSDAQRGGVTAGAIATLNYYQMPPVTEQERAVALERLKLTLNDLAKYGERPADLGQVSLLESIRSDKTARQLYLVLSSFFDPTIAEVKNGKELLDFKLKYNQFTKMERNAESEALEYIVRTNPGGNKPDPNSLLQYCILRAYRGNVGLVKQSGLNLYSIDWEQAEVFYGAFITDKQGGAWLIHNANQMEDLIGLSRHLLAAFQT